MKTEESNGYSQILMGSLLLWAVGQPAYGNGLGLCLHTRQREGRGTPQQAPRDVVSHVDAEGGTQTRRAREEDSMSEIKLKKTVAFLTQVPLFRNLGKRQLQSLARSMTPRRFAAGETVLRQGKGGIGLYVVLSGRTEAVHTRADGTRVVVNVFGPADYFGELAMINDEPRTASVLAVEDTECLVLVRWDFLGKLRRNRGMATVILQEQSRRFQRALSVL